MSNSSTLTLALFSFVSLSSAEEISKPANIISAGYGAGVFSSIMNLNLYTSAHYNFYPTGPIYFKYENKITPNTGLGICIAWINAKYSFDYVDTAYVSRHIEENHESYSVSLRVNYYIWKSEKIEVYSGAGLGFISHKGWYRNEVKNVFIMESVSPGFPFAFEVTIGERYFFSKKFGAYAEVGVAKSVFQGGITYRF